MSYPPTVPFESPPAAPPPVRRSRGPLIFGILASVVLLFVCGLFTVGVIVRSGAGPGVSVTAATTTSGPAATPGVGQAPTTRGDSNTIIVPDGVGLDYQSAQDLWRDAGLRVLPAKDALGAHRLPLIDSNWVVLAQDPPAGVEVARGSFITATVKKFTDD